MAAAASSMVARGHFDGSDWGLPRVRVPHAGETIQGDDFQLGFGGKGANQAVMARLLGAEVAMVNALGDDVFGDMTVHNFEAFGVDTTFLVRVPDSSGVAPNWPDPTDHPLT